MESTEQEKMSKLFKAQFETLRGYDADPAAEKKAAEELKEALREQVLKMKRADYDAFKNQMRDSLGAAFRADFDEYMGAFERNSREISLMDARQSFADYVGFLKENHQARNPEAVAKKRDLEGAFLDNARACIKNMGNDALLQKALEAEYGELDEETRKGMTPHFVSRLKNLWNDPDFYNKKQEREQAEPAKEDEQKAAGEKEAVIEQVVEEGEREAVKTGEEDGKESGEDAKTAKEDGKESGEDAKTAKETTTTVVKTETGKSWQEAFAAAKVYAEENGKRPVRPTHVKEIDADGMGVQLESGASFRVNPHKEDTMTMNTLREGVHLEDCLTMVDALKEKGYTAINVSKGSEEFRKAMYIAARIHGLTPKGFDQEKAQIWEQEAAATRKAMYGETTGRATETKSAATQEKSSETKEKTSGTKEKTSETKEKTAEEKTSAATTKKKFAAVTKEKDGVELDADKVAKFMGVVYDIAAVNAAKDAKKLSKEQLKEVREAWAETGFKNVTVSDVMRAAPDAPQGVNNDVFKANVDAMVGAVAPKTINEIEAHSVATTLTPTKEQSAEIDAAVKKMIKVYEKQTGEKKSKKTDKEATTGVYATLKGMAREYGVTMGALQDAVMKNQKLAQYGQVHPDFAEKIVTASFDHRKEGETSMFYQVKALEGEKMDRATRVAVKNQKKAQKAEDKRQKQEMSAAAKTKLMRQGAAR